MFRAMIAEDGWRIGERERIAAGLASLGLSIGAEGNVPADVLIVRRPPALMDGPAHCLRMLACDADSVPAVLPDSIDAAFRIDACDTGLADALADLGYIPFSPFDAAGLWPVLETLTGGDADVREELVQSLVDANTEDLHRLSEACRKQDWELARAMAHRIKGTARMLNCHALAAVSQVMETAATGADGNEVRAVLRLLAPAMHRLLAVLSTPPAS